MRLNLKETKTNKPIKTVSLFFLFFLFYAFFFSCIRHSKYAFQRYNRTIACLNTHSILGEINFLNDTVRGYVKLSLISPKIHQGTIFKLKLYGKHKKSVKTCHGAVLYIYYNLKTNLKLAC